MIGPDDGPPEGTTPDDDGDYPMNGDQRHHSKSGAILFFAPLFLILF